MKIFNDYLLFVFTFLLLLGCKEPYQQDIQSQPKYYLVVEGILNGNGPTTISLSRTNPVATNTIFYELGAKVIIETASNISYTLNEKGKGQYSAIVPASTTEKYRLHIRTKNGQEYFSEYVNYLKTPAIDEVNWKREKGGAQVYVNTHDPANNTWYYRYEFAETWKFRPAFQSFLDFKLLPTPPESPPNTPDIEVFPRDVSKWFPQFCWKSGSSTNIILASSKKLSQDIIHLGPVTFIPPASEKISVRYSILVKQYALDKAGFEYWQNMKKNTEQLGSIFDAQPSELRGNLYCATKADELVLGYFSASSVEEKRIYIDNAEVSNWNYQTECVEGFVGKVLASSVVSSSYLLFETEKQETDGIKKGYATGALDCVDCRLRGTDVKPDFWQD